jgi:hypothetical protein
MHRDRGARRDARPRPPDRSDRVFATYSLVGASDAVPEGRIANVAGARRGLVFALSGAM